MSSAVVSTSAALGRPFLFDADPEPEVSESSAKKPSAESLIKGFHSTIKNQQSTILHLGNRHSALENAILPASRLEIRPAPEMATSGVSALDALTGGLPRGCLTEIYGPSSSGRTSVMLAALAAATRRGEYCALIDASDALDPHSFAAAGVDLDRLLWVRCSENSPRSPRDTEKTNRGKEFIAKKSLNRTENEMIGRGANGKGTALAVPFSARSDAALAAEGRPFPLRSTLFGKTDRNLKPRIDKYNSGEDSPNRRHSEHRLEQVLRVTDLLLESGGFGLIILDLADIPPQSARRIPLTTWFRFRRAVEHKPTILLTIEQQPIAGSCSSLLLQLGVPSTRHSVLMANQTADAQPSHTQLLTGLEINSELIRSRLERKPARSIAFETKTAWAG